MNTQTAAGIQSYLDAILSTAKHIENELTRPFVSLPDETLVSLLATSVRDLVKLLKDDDLARWKEISTPYNAITRAVGIIESHLPLTQIGQRICDSVLCDEASRDALKTLALVSMSSARLIQEIVNQIIDPRTQEWFSDLDDDPGKAEDQDQDSRPTGCPHSGG